jgi:apolipoprotein N-acyltransferase
MRRYPALASLLLGAAAACGFAPWQLWPLTLVCLAAWLWLVHDAGTLRQALWRGWAFGVGHFTINDNWFQHAFDFQDKMPPVLGYIAPLALALYLAVYPALAAGLAWRLARGKAVDAPFLLAFAAAWIATEWLRAVMFTGYAWDPLGVVWVPVQPIAMLTMLIGTYALSGLTILAAGALLLIPRRRRAFGLLAIVALLGAQALSYRTAPPGPDQPLLRVVQPNIGNDLRNEDAGERALATLIGATSHPAGAPRLVLWPEGLLRDFLEDGYPDWIYRDRPSSWTRARIAAALAPGDMLMTSGDTLTFDAGGDVSSAANSVLAIDPDKRIVARYDKAHLVPYGEYLPMPGLLRLLGLAKLVPGDMDFTPGPGPRTLSIPGFGAIGIQVCYEIIFSGQVTELGRRPRMIFNPSNDAWFGKWGSPQFLAQARMRAIEEGLPVVRATPTGVSAVIAADGAVIATIPHHTAGAVEVPLPPAAAPTPFARVGNWMALIVTLALAGAAIALRRRER